MSYDLKCPSCDAQNAANRDSCWSCGSALGEHRSVTTRGNALPAGSREAKLQARYVDGYRAAAIIDGFGSMVKIIGFAMAGLSLLIGLSAGRWGFLGGLLVGGMFCALFFVLGVFISAQGQVLKAALDGAVHTSPFMTDEQKATILGV